MKKVLSIIGKVLLVLLITILFIFLTLVLTIRMICSNISDSAKELYVTTMLESGQMKFMADLFVSKEEIQALVNRNSVEAMNEEMDTELIKVTTEEKKEDMNNIRLEAISGTNYYAKMLVIRDPSRVKLSTTYPWGTYGTELENLVKKENALAGVNGGLYESTGNKGGKPLGVVVKDGKIQQMALGYKGLYIIGFDKKNILRIINIDGKNSNEVRDIVKKEKIRDAVTFQEESSDANNHFVKLIVNGEERKVSGKGSGANPRTAIGQKADGTVLLLVTDGRGASGHLGATAQDLIKIMKEYGAVNAANLDGGSSSSMYYKGKYEMSSVTFYYANSSWKLPTGFIVEKR